MNNDFTNPNEPSGNSSSLPPDTPPPSADEPTGFSFSLGTLMLAVTLTALLCGLCVSLPVLGIPLAVVSVPAWIFAARDLTVNPSITGDPTFGDKVVTFLSSVGIVIWICFTSVGLGVLGGSAIIVLGAAFNVSGGLALAALAVAIVVVVATSVVLCITMWPKHGMRRRNFHFERAMKDSSTNPNEPGEKPKRFTFSLETLMLAMTLVTVLCGLCVSEPLVGFSLAFLTALAWFRAWKALDVDPRTQADPTLGDKLSRFGESFGVVLLALLASVTVGVVICSIMYVIGVLFGSFKEPRSDFVALGVVISVFGTPALFFDIWIRMWPERRPTEWLKEDTPSPSGDCPTVGGETPPPFSSAG